MKTDDTCTGPSGSSRETDVPRIDPVGIRLSEVSPVAVRWLWPGRIPLAKLTILDGDPGLGKSTLTLDLAARVSVGAEMPDGSPGVNGGVVLVTVEDGLDDTVVPRLGAAGANLERILALQEIGRGHDARPIVIPGDLASVEEAIDACQAKLLVIDPLMAVLDGRVNAHRDQDVRRAFVPLHKLADRTGVAVVLVRHLNKLAGSNPLYRGGGSIGLVGAARSGLIVFRPTDDAPNVLASTKSNLAAPAPSLEYRLEVAGSTSVVRWLGPSPLTAHDMSLSDSARERSSKIEEAVIFLENVLGDGPLPVTAVMKEADAIGITDRTLLRAKRDLGVKSRKVGASFPGAHWEWFVPEKTVSPVQPAREGSMATLATFPTSRSTGGLSSPSKVAISSELEAFGTKASSPRPSSGPGGEECQDAELYEDWEVF